MSTARRHHHLPEAYLAGFTDSGTKDGHCFVLDIQTGKRFRARPRKFAVERDFNRVEVDGEEPDALEREFGELEGRAVAAIRRASDLCVFPQGDDYDYIINFIVLIAIRNPRMRESWNRARAHQARVFARWLVSSKNRFDHIAAQAREAGYVPEEGSRVSYEAVKGFIEGGQYDVVCPRAGNQVVEIRAFTEMLQIFAARRWSLCVAPRNGPELVCSDHPVTLTWKEPTHGPLGFGLANTEVCVPLSRKIGFYGVFEDELPLVVQLTELGVAEFNNRVAANASRQVFSGTESFLLRLDGKVTDSKAVFA